MAFRGSGLADIGAAGACSHPGASDVIVFRYDSRHAKFTRVSGGERAFLGHTRMDWLSTSFLESILTGTDRAAVPATMASCAGGQHVVFDCALVTATGAEVSAVVAGVASESDPAQISGQIVILDPEVLLTRKHYDPQVVHVDLMRMLVCWLSQQTRALSGYGDLLTRHVGVQGDDVGGEYALGIRTSIDLLDQVITRLRPLTTPAPGRDDVAEVIDFLMHEIRAEGASRLDG